MSSCSHVQQQNRHLPRQKQLSYCPSLSLEVYSWYSDGPEPTVCYSHCWICRFSAAYAHCYPVMRMVFTTRNFNAASPLILNSLAHSLHCSALSECHRYGVTPYVAFVDQGPELAVILLPWHPEC